MKKCLVIFDIDNEYATNLALALKSTKIIAYDIFVFSIEDDFIKFDKNIDILLTCRDIDKEVTNKIFLRENNVNDGNNIYKYQSVDIIVSKIIEISDEMYINFRKSELEIVGVFSSSEPLLVKKFVELYFFTGSDKLVINLDRYLDLDFDCEINLDKIIYYIEVNENALRMEIIKSIKENGNSYISGSYDYNVYENFNRWDKLINLVEGIGKFKELVIILSDNKSVLYKSINFINKLIIPFRKENEEYDMNFISRNEDIKKISEKYILFKENVESFDDFIKE